MRIKRSTVNMTKGSNSPVLPSPLPQSVVVDSVVEPIATESPNVSPSERASHDWFDHTA